MSVNRSGYYKWEKREQKENIYQTNRRILTDLLIEQHKRHPSYGYHRLARLIKNETGWIFSDNLAHKCCNHNGIYSSIRNTYKYRKPGNEHIHFPNVVAGKWNVEKPLEIVSSDMTILKYRGKTYEWTYLLDVFDNSIISSHVSGRAGDTRPYYRCLKDLKTMTIEKTAPTVLHTDQGAVYSSIAYNKGLTNYNIERSMSRVGTPTDNPIIESINGWVKGEIYSDFDIDSADSIEEFLEDFIIYYNTERPAFALGYLTPKQYREECGFT